jgi:hypothetical protein
VAGARLTRRTIVTRVPLDLLTALPLDALQLAHETNVPHDEPRSSGGGVNIVLIVVGAVVTVGLVGSLVWLKERMRKLEERERADEHASAGAEGAG